MVIRRGSLALLLLLVPVLAQAQQRPSFTVQPGGVVSAVLPLGVLQDANVRKQLESGLTTTFFVLVRHGGAASHARLEVRYDLWDEVWIVRRVEFDRAVQRDRLAGRDALERWWRTPLRILSTSEPRVSLRVEVDVLPFSAAEEEDARAWISKSGGVGTAAGSGGTLVDALIGTTLSAKPITSFRWNVELALR